ncbi:hypothetical protein PF005_g13598 [Phytophthora fragariae]|uniref:DUF6604 domain-containing protein n=1 Tax=Phytophthora fragariae TaxID=53985 RepID=A0A6A4DB98_9STRA|nr:hypothetical protein PF003_g427 [Phytophthora fragariae]KAE8935444.1 hypothetical protein PF009_g14615 [Phytophthora fragariae]KAE9004380.1 hypothetical protein PF011_g12486 [Phytophthora fragariae]KAE9106098.1 hypothetical protein PF007_g13533 [Phytophthora fragariae]KAE9142208.1 hypothetical protein PF006_g12672 [Phytophthora fragariae]
MVSFPATKYARYKRATAFFLDWLLRARGRGRHAGHRVQVDALGDVVHEIAAEPTSLTPKLLAELPKALAACRCAITLREHVATFFDDDEQGHQHFLGLLRAWYKVLKGIDSEVKKSCLPSTVELSFENYYEVLQVEEDYFPDEESFNKDKQTPKKVKADRKSLFDEAFAEDKRLEVVYFFLELEELVGGVFDIYEQVKKQERTMAEAAVVAKVAMDLARALTAKLQLRYPSLKTAEDVLAVVLEHAPSSLKAQMLKLETETREKFEKEKIYRFVPGMLLSDFVNVWGTLDKFVLAFPNSDRQLMCYPDGYFGENYHEERTPHYVLPDDSNMVPLLLQQLPLIYNMVQTTKASTGSGYKRSSGSMSASFLALMQDYFESRKVTVPVVFACICWLKSVAALQGNAGLSRNVSLTFKHGRELVKIVEATMEKGSVLAAYYKYHGLLQQCAESIDQYSHFHHLARANPIMAGFLMLDRDMAFLLMSSRVLNLTSRFKAFGHLYNALLKEGFLQHIPFIDNLLDVYEETIFTPSRDAAVHGRYTRTYLLSSNLNARAVNSIYQNNLSTIPDSELAQKRKDLDIVDLSKILGLLLKEDMSFLDTSSCAAMLNTAASVCSKELFETRELSRNVMTFNDDLTDTFTEIVDRLERRPIYDDYIACQMAGQSPQNSFNTALEMTVMHPLIILLDGLQPNGFIDVSKLPRGLGELCEGYIIDPNVFNVACKKAAAVIAAKFGASPQICEQRYFTYPAHPDFVKQEYGAASLEGNTENERRGRVFAILMNILKNAKGPLRGRELSFLKDEIKKDPDLLRLVSPRSSSSGSDSSTSAFPDDLCTLLHQAAAGPAHDVDLVEWMIQLGALVRQPTLYCRNSFRHRDHTCSEENLPNTMAVHSAAIAGYDDIVRVILESDSMVDLNTPTFQTTETLALLAAKHGKRNVLDMLTSFMADLRIPDRNGKLLSDVTEDQAWSRELAKIVDDNFERQADWEDVRIRDSLFWQQRNPKAERLRSAVRNRRDEKQASALINANNVGVPKRQTAKKGKKGKTTAWGVTNSAIMATDSEEISNLLENLIVSPGLKASASSSSSDLIPTRRTVHEESIAKMSAMFARLRDPDISTADKADDMQRVCKRIEQLMHHVDYLTQPDKLDDTDPQLRTTIASEASTGRSHDAEVLSS